MAEKNWKTGLFECCSDCSTCCYGFWCCPCLACTVSEMFGESTFTPLFDFFSPALCVACGIPFFIPPVAVSLRASIRNKHGIKGSICDDVLVSCFCIYCTWCQMHRELKKDNTTPQPQPQPQVIIMQPQAPPAPVINVQANPVMMVNSSAPAPPSNVLSNT